MGALVSTPVPELFSQLLWTHRETKGGHTRLETRLRAVLLTKGILDPGEEEASFESEVLRWRAS